MDTLDQDKLYPESGWALSAWKAPIPGHAYVIGADASEGLPGKQRDYSAFYVLDYGEYELVAAFHGKPNTREFAFRLGACGYLYNNALIGCEDMGAGQAVNELLELMGYPNLFYRDPMPTDLDKSPKRGFKTTEGGDFSRVKMLNRLKLGTETERLKNPDRNLLKEMLNFVWVNPKRGGEAARGQHDDRVMAAAFTLTLMEYWYPFSGPTQYLRDLTPRTPKPGEGYGTY